jgi:hypothetical protein
MNSTEQWLLATKSRLTPNAPAQRKSLARTQSPIQSLHNKMSGYAISSRNQIMCPVPSVIDGAHHRVNILSALNLNDELQNRIGRGIQSERLTHAQKHKVRCCHFLLYFQYLHHQNPLGAQPLPVKQNSKIKI